MPHRTLASPSSWLRVPRSLPRLALRYGTALLLTALATALTVALLPLLQGQRFLFLFAAVALSAWGAGAGPALLSTVVGVLAADYLVIPPVYSLSIRGPRDLFPLAVFAGVALLISRVSATLRERSAELEEASHRLRASMEAQRAEAERVTRLQQVTAALSRTLTPEQVAEVLVEHGIAALGAQSGSLAVLDPGKEELEVVRAMGYSQEVTERFRHLPLEARFPLADAVREGEPIILPDGGARDARYPHLAEVRRANGGGAMAAVPLAVGGRVLGAVGLNFPEGRTLDEEDRAFLLTLVEQCAQALERARLFEAERAARAEAEEANRAKFQFLTTMSHELRTPLNAIAGYVEILTMGVRGPLPDAARADLERIRRSQLHLLGLINDVLNFARIEAGHVHFELADVPLDEALQEVEALITPQVEAKRIAYASSGCAPGTTARADREKLRQILLNLLSNAVKFTEAEGKVWIRCEEEDGWVRVHVEDTGCGIPEEKLERIFDPFVQVQTGYTRTREGTGLGLAISRDLARGMGGDVTARSRPGEGSVFTLALPAAS